jgi:hypothetical protein
MGPRETNRGKGRSTSIAPTRGARLDAVFGRASGPLSIVRMEAVPRVRTIGPYRHARPPGLARGRARNAIRGRVGETDGERSRPQAPWSWRARRAQCAMRVQGLCPTGWMLPARSSRVRLHSKCRPRLREDDDRARPPPLPPRRTHDRDHRNVGSEPEVARRIALNQGIRAALRIVRATCALVRSSKPHLLAPLEP